MKITRFVRRVISRTTIMEMLLPRQREHADTDVKVFSFLVVSSSHILD